MGLGFGGVGFYGLGFRFQGFGSAFRVLGFRVSKNYGHMFLLRERYSPNS